MLDLNNKLRPRKLEMIKKKQRNPHAFNPIMKKGGVHEKTNKAKRVKEKARFNKELKKSARSEADFFCLSFFSLAMF